MPRCLKRVENVRNYRLASKRASTRRIADKPTHFQTENMPAGNYIVVPQTSSENRYYIPIGFMPPESLCSNAVRIVPNATLYHFGVLTSSAHMAWMRVVTGRLKSSYQYASNIVYNNFPWPEGADEAAISATAQGILDARQKYPDSSLADLYDPLTMPADLRAAHQANDKAVLAAYGLKSDTDERALVAHLFALYAGRVES